MVTKENTGFYGYQKKTQVFMSSKKIKQMHFGTSLASLAYLSRYLLLLN